MSRDELTTGQLLDIVQENGLHAIREACGYCRHSIECAASNEAIAELRRRYERCHRWRRWLRALVWLFRFRWAQR